MERLTFRRHCREGEKGKIEEQVDRRVIYKEERFGRTPKFTRPPLCGLMIRCLVIQSQSEVKVDSVRGIIVCS